MDYRSFSDSLPWVALDSLLVCHGGTHDITNIFVRFGLLGACSDVPKEDASGIDVL